MKLYKGCRCYMHAGHWETILDIKRGFVVYKHDNKAQIFKHPLPNYLSHVKLIVQPKIIIMLYKGCKVYDNGVGIAICTSSAPFMMKWRDSNPARAVKTSWEAYIRRHGLVIVYPFKNYYDATKI